MHNEIGKSQVHRSMLIILQIHTMVHIHEHIKQGQNTCE